MPSEESSEETGHEPCEKCGEVPELIEEASVNPLSGDAWDRYKCDCGYTTVRVPA